MAKKKNTRQKRKGGKASRTNSGSRASLLVGLFGVILILGVIASYYYQKEDANQAPLAKKEKVQSETSSTSGASDASQEPGTPEREEPVETPDVNPDLPDYEDVDEYYFTNSFDFAWPAYDADDLIVEHEGFTVSYDERNEQATWVAYKLERSNLSQARFRRKDNFRADPRIRSKSATPEDYRKSGYDRGHLAPAADFTWSEKALDDTFFMSNMSPQVPAFNRGIWKSLEEKVREWARENDYVYVVTGPIIQERKERIGKNRVTVPQYFYKVILDIQEPDLKAIGFVMKNEGSDNALSSFAVKVDRVEEMTGLDFFPSIPDEMENRLEGSMNITNWE